MSDTGRQDVTDKVSEEPPHRPSLEGIQVTIEVFVTIQPADQNKKVKDTVTPDSQKSTLDKAGDTVKGKADKAAGSVQPESDKSTTQKASDSTTDTMGSAGEQVSHPLQD
jgi:hypothetical protein